jgi:hypothetical protein
MTVPPPASHAGSPPGQTAKIAATVLLAGALGFGAFSLWRLQTRIDQLVDEQAKTTATLANVLGEVTRFRLEQSAGSKGPHALLEKLRTYAPLLASSRTSEPDFRNALKEMEAILLAFTTLGKDAWEPLQERLASRKADTDFDEIKWLLEASIKIDKAATTPILEQILLGRRLPSPRLRWYAAEALTRTDRPVAQAALRRILLTETSRGIDPDRAAYYGGGVPDAAALAQSGFNNFVIHYVRTEDEKIDETLQMVIARSAQDAMTVQECVKFLGERRAVSAIETLEKLFAKPPMGIENPLFLNHCLDALVAIQGKDARPFLEKALAKTNPETVTTRVQHHLKDINSGKVDWTTSTPKSDKK